MMQPSKIYVAGSIRSKDYAKEVMEILEKEKHTITFDWTKLPDTYSPNYIARSCLKGVKDCDILVLLYQKECKGSMIEAGYALAFNKPTLYISLDGARPGQMAASFYRFDSIEAIVSELRVCDFTTL